MKVELLVREKQLERLMLEPPKVPIAANRSLYDRVRSFILIWRILYIFRSNSYSN